MNVFTCNDHSGHWVGAASVVVAENEADARKLLDAALDKAQLAATDYTLQEVDTSKPSATILQDGDY